MNNDAYGHTVSMTSDGTFDYYLVGGSVTYTFAAGTSQDAVYLSIAKQWNLPLFKAALQTFIQNLYDRDTQLQLLCMYVSAQASLKLNRQAYIGQLLTWLDSVESYAATYVAAVNAMSDPAVVAATEINTAQIPAAPTVTVLGAIQIPN